jgi:ribonuclease PH
VHDAIKHLMDKKLISESPLIDYVAAISVGLHQGNPLLDLDYSEDSSCDTDMNIVMTGSGGFVEIQGTAEGTPFSREMMDQMSDLAAQGIKELIQLQKNVLK